MKDYEHKPKFKLLIADDELTNRMLAKAYLSNLDLELIEADNGKDALDLIYSEHPELILLDIRMPMLDGFQILEDLNRNQSIRNTSIIVMTAITETDYLQKAFELGASDFVNKPFKRAELISRIKNQMSNRIFHDHKIETEKLKTAIAIGGAVAHEMTQPLFAITMLIDLYHEKHGKNEIITKIGIQSQRLNDLIKKFSNIRQLITKSYADTTVIVDIQQSAVSEKPDLYTIPGTGHPEIVLHISDPLLEASLQSQLCFMQREFLSARTPNDLTHYLSHNEHIKFLILENPQPTEILSIVNYIQYFYSNVQILGLVDGNSNHYLQWKRKQDQILMIPAPNDRIFQELRDFLT